MSYRETFSTMWGMILWRMKLVRRKDYDELGRQYYFIAKDNARLKHIIQQLSEEKSNENL